MIKFCIDSTNIFNYSYLILCLYSFLTLAIFCAYIIRSVNMPSKRKQDPIKIAEYDKSDCKKRRYIRLQILREKKRKREEEKNMVHNNNKKCNKDEEETSKNSNIRDIIYTEKQKNIKNKRKIQYNLDYLEKIAKKKCLEIDHISSYLSTSHGMVSFTPEYIKYLKESYENKSFIGMPEYKCKHCNAIFWFEERNKRETKKRKGEIIYSNCCKNNKIKIPPFQNPPETLARLLNNKEDNLSKHFMQKIRQYNSLFSFTSMGGTIDKNINNGDGPYVFRVNGQIHHRIGCLLPKPNEIPKFAELYIFDTKNEIENRIHALNKEEMGSTDINPYIVEQLKKMFDEYNPLVKTFRYARDLFEEHKGVDFSIRIIGADKGDPIQYEMPHTEDLAILIVGELNLENYKRDIIVQNKNNGLQRISIFHPAYMALQYPLLFPYGERGFQLGIPYYNSNTNKKSKKTRSTITVHEYYKYHMHYRPNQPNPYLCYGRLSKQAIVDARAIEDEDRLMFIAKNQNKLRAECLQGIFDAVQKGLTEGNQIGKKIILPSSHVGSKRYTMQNYYDGIAICRVYGPPHLFITFTCNPRWPEITMTILENEQPNDRPDIIVRVFHIKLEQLIEDIQSGTIFGPTTAILYSVEFQKRGLPHVHILVWLDKKPSEITIEMIDKWISTEIPDPREDPLGYILIAEHMMHGPCGAKNENCPCMKKGKCSKFYPKEFNDQTNFTENGFAQYKRRNTNIYIRKDNHNLDNRWVVPHNLFLLKRYQAHLNVEFVNQSRMLKYLCKYVNKGGDKAKIIFQRIKQGIDHSENEQTEKIDEIEEYLECRYICDQDGMWRLLGYEIHYHWPPVERMPVHLPLMNMVKLTKDTKLKNIIENPDNQRTMLTEWFMANQLHEEARNLTYCEFPQKWKWDKKERKWVKRQHGFKIARLYYVKPTEGERFYLRMLLMIVKGAKNYEDIRTYNGITYKTFKETCAARGLLMDDNEWYKTFDEAASWATSPQLRSLFIILLLYCNLEDERKFFETNWAKMVDDIKFQLISKYHPIKYNPTDIELKDILIEQIEYLLSKSGISIDKFNLPQMTVRYKLDSTNTLIQDELNYNANDLEEQANKLYLQLNDDQKKAFHLIVNSVINKESNFFFVSGHGGTGKTFLWNTIVSFLRAKKEIVLTVASSGVASLLLPNGRTAHSRFRIPVDIDELSLCDIKRGTKLAELLIETSLIIWDEALMTNRQCFEALDRTLRDILSEKYINAIDKPFGGKVVVLGGDPKQILPVIENASKLEIINASIVKSYLWGYVKKIFLFENMRLQKTKSNTLEYKEINDFNNWILDIGNGKINTKQSTAQNEDTDTTIILVPENLLINTGENKLEELVKFTYPDFKNSFFNPNYLKNRAILATTNEIVDEVNNYILSLVPNQEKEYYSADTLSQCMDTTNDADILYPVEYLNSLNANNFPTHVLKLKVGVPIILLRNLNQNLGLCNGTRLIITNLGDNIIEGIIITGTHIGEKAYIPRINLTTRGNQWPFTLCRRQFPIKVCYSMTINKSQGQTLSNVGLYLKKPVFTHGQLYVAISRVSNSKGLKILIENEDGTCATQTKNIVYREILDSFRS